MDVDTGRQIIWAATWLSLLKADLAYKGQPGRAAAIAAIVEGEKRAESERVEGAKRKEAARAEGTRREEFAPNTGPLRTDEDYKRICANLKAGETAPWCEEYGYPASAVAGSAGAVAATQTREQREEVEKEISAWGVGEQERRHRPHMHEGPDGFMRCDPGYGAMNKRVCSPRKLGGNRFATRQRNPRANKAGS